MFRKAATEGPQCVTAAIFWMKTRGGWREAPQAHEIAVKPACEMTDEELKARIRTSGNWIPLRQAFVGAESGPARVNACANSNHPAARSF